MAVVALTGTNRGTAAASTASNVYNLLPASNFAAGALAVICISADNSASGGSSNNIDTVTDALGNTWTKRLSALYDPGAANAGIQGAIFTTPQNGGALTTSSTIQIGFGAVTTVKSYTLHEVTAASGYFAQYRTGAAGSGSATTVPTVTTASINNGEMVIGALFNEYGTGQTVTEDTDTTNGSWSVPQTAKVGATAAGNTISSQRKVVTATATQTYNPTLGTVSDVILGWIAIAEYSNVNGSSATTNANDAPAATGAETFVGTSATTNANDAGSATGEVAAEAVTGTSATTNANDAPAATGAETFVGTSATTNANDAPTANGAVANPVTGTSATTNANDAGNATGTETFVGTSATTNANDTGVANDFTPGGGNDGVVVAPRRTAIILDGRAFGAAVPTRRTVVSV